MEGCRAYDDSHMKNVLLKNDCTSEVLNSVWAPNSSPSFHGSASMVNFDNQVENCNDELEHHPEKKRRLAPNQVEFLEKSFEVENKLEPDRKMQLAKELGLQPRQIAIWFQNRRARCKTKVLEKEYVSLKANYDKIKADYDTLFAENEKLKNKVNLLNQKLLMRVNGKSKQEPCDPISPLDFGPKNSFLSGDGASNVAATSARSDVLDSDSPHCNDGNLSAALELADSSHVLESDFSQDEDEFLSRSLIQPAPTCFPKLEIECCDDLQPNSCNLGFPVQDHGTWFWQ